MKQSFKIYATPKRNHYFRVNFYETHKEMLKTIRKKHGNNVPPYKAIFDYHCNGKQLAIISFCRPFLTTSTVLHEASHAVIQYFRVLQIPFDYLELKDGLKIMAERPKEEMFCTMIPYLVNQITNKLTWKIKQKRKKQPGKSFSLQAKFYGWQDHSSFPVARINC